MTALGCVLLLAPALCAPAAAAPATARPQSAVPCALTVVQTRLAAGAIEMVIGDNFPTTPASVPLFIEGFPQVGLANIDGTGHFADPIRVPNAAPTGTHTLTAQCGDRGEATAAITVVPAAEARAAEHARGAPAAAADDDDDDPLVLAGVAAALVVLALVLTRRRRAQRLAV